MNAIDRSFAAVLRDCSKKEGRFARPYAVRLYRWLKDQGAILEDNVLKRGKITYCFTAVGNYVKFSVKEEA
jgi:hypothetical protein